MIEQHLRIARPTNDLEKIVRQYREGLDLIEVCRFQDENGNHDGFDGVMLGRKGFPYHFEFTFQHGAAAESPPSEECLLVFYVPNELQWNEACQKVLAAGFVEVEPGNPYWARSGRTFADFDGYRIVIENAAWIRD